MMAALKEFGVVVVGLGIAGGVRVRDLKEKSCGFSLKGVVSRRPVELPDVTSMTLDDTLANSNVGAMLICTENKLHEEYAKRGLENGKHVLIEFPVALSSKKATELYSLAEEKGLVLWEEDIALLTATHKMVKSKVEQVGIKSVIFSVTGNYNGWIEKFDESGPPFIGGISSLHTMVDLFGELNVLNGTMERNDDGYTATASLETLDKKPITITLTRSNTKDRFRKKSAVYEFINGEVIDLDKIPPTPPSKPGLFMQDLHQFYEAVVAGKNNNEAQKRSVYCLEIAEKIHSFFK